MLVITLLATVAHAAGAGGAAETPQLAFVREYIRELGKLERLRTRVEEVVQQPDADHMAEMIGYTTLISPTPDASGEPSQLRITGAEREALLKSLAMEFGETLDVKSRHALTSAAAVLRGYLRKDFTTAGS